MADPTDPPYVDVDTTTKQSINNLTCFAVSISICVVALLAQLFNVFLVFRLSAGKARRIFFYLLLASAILCSLLYVTICSLLVLGYNTSHSYAWIRYLYLNNAKEHPGYANFLKYYKVLQLSGNVSFSLFTVLYLLCVQLRFRAIRAIFNYPKWIDHGLIILTLGVWFSVEFMYGVVFYPLKPSFGNEMVAIWALYVLFTDNVLSGIFLCKLWKVKNNVLICSSRHRKISRSIIRAMAGLCCMLWISLTVFGLTPKVLDKNESQNLSMVIFCFAAAFIPLFFSLGFAWMEAVVQLYSEKPYSMSKPINSSKVSPGDSKNFTLSMKVKAISQATDSDREGWASVLSEESGYPYGCSGSPVETHHTTSIAQVAE